MPTRNRPSFARFAAAAAALTLTLALTGCALTGTAPPSPVTGAALQGTIHGGQSPISGAHIYLYAANTTGYNTTGATNPSVSLLNNVPGSTAKDSSGNYYVTSDSSGNFSITSDYTCTPGSGSVAGQQVYLYAIGGSQGGVANAASGLMAVLGDCPAAGTFAGSIPSLVMNEVTTVAAAYAMAGFAYDATHVSSSGTTLAKTGIKNAFANAANLVALSTGTALATTPAGNGTVPQATIYTLANILAACVNSNGAVTGPTNPSTCYALFNNAESAGSTGTVPSDTATAAINIAHNPGANVSTLYGLPSTVPPFGSALTAQPNDFTLGIFFNAGSGIAASSAAGIAIDAEGNVWIASRPNQAVVKLSSSGANLSGTYGYLLGEYTYATAIDGAGNVWEAGGYYEYELSNTGVVSSKSPYSYNGVISIPYGAAIDGYGNAWTTNYNSNTLAKISTSTGVSGYVGGGASGFGIAVDGSGNVWFGGPNNTLQAVANSGKSYTFEGQVGGISGVYGVLSIAIDSSGNAWVGSSSAYIAKVSNSGSVLSGTNGYTGGGLDDSWGIAIDGSGKAWVTHEQNNNVTELSTAGAVLSGSNGYSGGFSNATIEERGIATDGSGNVWISDASSTAGLGTLELIGVSTPVITPIAAGLPSTPTSNGTSNLGTRP